MVVMWFESQDFIMVVYHNAVQVASCRCSLWRGCGYSSCNLCKNCTLCIACIFWILFAVKSHYLLTVLCYLAVSH